MTSIYRTSLGTEFERLHPKMQWRFDFSSANGVCQIGTGVMDEVWRGPWWTLSQRPEALRHSPCSLSPPGGASARCGLRVSPGTCRDIERGFVRTHKERIEKCLNC